MVFGKWDRQRTVSDATLTGATTKRLIESISDTNARRMRRGGGYKWDILNPPLLGSVSERWSPLFFPVTPEASAIEFRLRYECDFAPVNVRASLIYGPGLVTDPGSAVAFAVTANRTTSAWFTIDLTEAHRHRLRTAQVALRLSSDASATTGSSVIAINYTDRLEMTTDLTGTFNPSDVLKMSFIDGAGSPTPLDWYGIDVGQGIRLEPDFLYIWPEMDGSSMLRASGSTINLTRYGQLRIYGIEYREVFGVPYKSQEQHFPWESEVRAYAPVATGRGGSGNRIGKLYGAQEYLATQRTPVYSIFPQVPGGQVPATWLDYDSSYTQYPHRNIRSSPAWLSLCESPVLNDIGFGGTAPITERRALEVSLWVLPIADAPTEHEWSFRAVTYDGAGGVVTTGIERIQKLNPVSRGSYQYSIYRMRAQQTGAPASNGGIARNNLHGLFEMPLMGNVGLVEITMFINDDAVTKGQYLQIQAKGTSGAPGQQWTFIVMGLIVRPPGGVDGRTFSLIGR